MFFKKLFTFFLCFIFIGQSVAQTQLKTEIKKTDVSPEVQEKAVVLLKSLAREAEQFSLPLNRIQARVLVADLLWERDEKQARLIFQSAISELNAMINKIPPENPDSDDEFNTERYGFVSDAQILRSELLLALGTRDPAFALDALQSFSRKTAEGSSIFEDDKTLELSLATKIAEKDPKQAYALAKANLENGIDSGIFSTLENLYEKDAELGAKLAHDIAGKIKSKDTRIASPNDYIGNTMSNIANVAVKINQNAGFTVNLWEVQSFLDTVKKLNQLALKNKKTVVLNENETKELIDVLAQIFIKQKYLSAYEVSKVMPDIARYFPAQAQAIRRKIGQNESSTLNNLVSKQIFENETEDKSADEVLQIIEKGPIEERDDLYYKAAETAYTNHNIEEARKFYNKIKTKRENDYLGKGIEDGLPLALAEKGDLREVRQALAKLKTNEERIEILTTLSETVAQSGDKKLAASLLDEARSMYAGRMKSRKNLASVLQIAQAYSFVEPNQSFAFLESNMPFLNDVIGAAILLDEFDESGAVENEELRLDTARRESYRNVPKAVTLIKNLTAADLDRTVSLADKFSRSEVRFFACYRIAVSLLDPKAEENEKEFQANMESEEAMD